MANGKMTETERADLSKLRGTAAAKVADPIKKREFIAAQGKLEEKGELSRPAVQGLQKGAVIAEVAGANYVSRDELHIPKGARSGKCGANERVLYKKVVEAGSDPEGAQKDRRKTNRVRDGRTNLGKGKSGIVEVEG